MESSQQLLYVFLIFTLCFFFLINSSIALNAINSVHSKMSDNPSCAACLGGQCGNTTLEGIKNARNAGIASVIIALLIILILGYSVYKSSMIRFDQTGFGIFIAILFFIFIITTSVMFNGMSGIYNKLSNEACGINCIQKTCDLNICAIKDSRNSLIISITTCSLALAMYVFVIYKKVMSSRKSQ